MLKIDDFFQIGRFTKLHGKKGELALASDYDLSDFAEDSNSFLICEMDGLPVPFFIESYRQINDMMGLVRFAEIDTEDKAKAFIGKPVYLPTDSLPSFDASPSEWERFTGFLIIDERAGAIGRITGVDDQTLNILFRVAYQEKELLVPVAFMTGYDHGQKEITIILPDGFWEI